MVAALVRRFWYSFRTDSLFRNSIYLMVSTGTIAGFAFIFWVICSQLFTPSEIGAATTLISAMTVISYASLLGFNNTFVRFLPTSNDRNNELNTGLLLSAGAAIVLSALYLIAIPQIAPKLLFVRENLWYEIAFLIIAPFFALNLLTDFIFVALRAAKYNLLIDGFILGGTKLFLPFVFLSLKAYGIFAAFGTATLIATLVSLGFLITKFAYRPSLRLDWLTLTKVAHYSSATYIGNLFSMAPVLLLPLIVLNHLGQAAAGYYFLAFTIANLLYGVVYAVAHSLFAEGSYDEQDLKKLVRRSIVVTGSVLIPASIMLFFGAPFVLRIFGESYATEAVAVLRIFVIASPALALYVFGTFVLRIKKRVYSLIIVNVIYFIAINSLAYIWVDRGLVLVGYAWLAGNLLAGLASVLVLRTKPAEHKTQWFKHQCND